MSSLATRETLLVDMTMWLARIMQYSATHPACEKLGEKVLASVQSALAVSAPISFGIAKDSIAIGDEGMASHPSVRNRLARHLHERGVLVVRLAVGTNLAELTSFMDVMTLPVQTIFDRGGVKRLLLASGVSRLQVEEVSHDITEEEREAQNRRKELRTFFNTALKDLLAQRALGIDIGEKILELLEHPEVAVALLEDDPLGVTDAVAALCIMVRQETDKAGADAQARVDELFPKLRKILLSLSPPSHDRVLLGFPALVGEFREGLAWAFHLLSEEDVAFVAIQAVCRHATELELPLYALCAICPHTGRRRSTLRRLGLFLYDLPADDPVARELLEVLAHPVDEHDSYRDERDCVTPHAERALAMRVGFGKRTSGAPHAAGTSSSSSNTSGGPPPNSILGGVPTQKLDARRVASDVVLLSSRTRRFDRLCDRLPKAVNMLAEAGSIDAAVGILTSLQTVTRADSKEIAESTLRKLASEDIVRRMLAELDATSSASEGTERDETIEIDTLASTVRLLAVLQPNALLDRLDESESRKMRRILMDALPLAGNAALMPLLRAKLRSPKWFVVRNAVALIPRVGGTARELMPIVHHPNEKVRAEVARAIRSMPPDVQSTEIASTYLGDAAQEVRIHARGMIRGDLISQTSLMTLERLATDPKQHEDVQRTAIQLIGQCPKDAAANVLFQLMQPKGLIDIGSVRDLAAVALKTSRAPGAAALFEQGLHSSVWRVRKACERAMGRG